MKSSEPSLGKGISPDTGLIKRALRCKCPKCNRGELFKPGLSMELHDKCSECGFNLSDNDVGDGPAVFLIFILGFLLVPMAVLLDWLIEPPLWAHAIIWTIAALSITLGSLKPLKSYIFALEYKHRLKSKNDD